MNRDPEREILSALLDGEEIEAEPLARALAAPGGPEALLDFVLLRAAAAGDDARPGASFYDAMQPLMARASLRRGRVVRRLTVATAAAVLLAALLVLRPGRPGLEDGAPPQPSRVLHFETDGIWEGGR